MQIGIIGPGKVGTALGIAARQAGYSRLLVAGSGTEAAVRGAERIGDGARPATLDEAAAADLVWLTVPDRRIESVATSIAAWLRPGATLVHCSGALSASILTGARDAAGCVIAAAHPIQTFPTVTAAVADLPGSVWALEGEPAALEVIEPFLKELGSRTLRIDAEGKTRLHVAAVLACNDLVALLDTALDLAEPAVGDRATALDALLPIVEATVRNVAALGPLQSLTGPIVRGDLGTLRTHLEQLAHESPSTRAVYAALGMRALELATRRSALDDATRTAMAELLRAIADPTGGTPPPAAR